MSKLTFSAEDYKLILQMEEILDCARVILSDILPSVWAEQNRILPEGVSDISGPFRFWNSPYAREILDCLHSSSTAEIIAIMKAAQIGFSTSLVENAIGWIMSQSPGNILYLVGHEDNLRDSMDKLDKMIDGAGLRPLLGSEIKRARKTKSGDTDHRKDFPGGHLRFGLTKYKSLRNFSSRFGFIDDFDAMVGRSEVAGSTEPLIMQRFAAFAKKKKVWFLSSPELKGKSNIEAVYYKGDQRKYHIPCPCCGEFIRLEWEIKSEKDGQPAGMTWQLDEFGQLIPESVGYTCYKCNGFFDDKNKMELLNAGKWIPSAKPSQPGYRSYHISALYAPTFMDGWLKYTYQWIACNPIGQKRIEGDYQVFMNAVLGLPYEPTGESISASDLQTHNLRPYEVGTIPEKLSMADGNGRIVLLTCGADLNGKEDDARLDYEIVAWSETGASYSIDHGSIGTFVPKDPGKVDRKRWTYKKGHPDSVWPAFDEVRNKFYTTDTGRRIQILITGIDSGYQTTLVYDYVDKSNNWIVSLKGKDEDKNVAIGVDKKTFKQSQEKGNLYLVESNVVKDQLAELVALKWSPEYHEAQPAWFMNFPTPSGGKYLLNNYFSHFESESRVLDKDKAFRWMKKSPNHQNHLWDCRCYNIAVKDIFLQQFLNDRKIKNGIWADYSSWIGGIAKKMTNPK